MLSILCAAAGVGLAIAAIAVWVRIIQRWWRGQPLVDFQPRRDAAWDLPDVVMTVMLLFLSNIVLITTLNHQFGITDAASLDHAPLLYHLWTVLGGSLASLATLSISVTMILLRHRLSLRDLGLVSDTPWRDVQRGFAAFLVLAPPTYGLQALLVQWFKSRHPIVELIGENPDSWLISASVFSAVVIAPVFEEYLFRGLLQGWLERLAWSTDLPRRRCAVRNVDLGHRDSQSAPPLKTDSGHATGEATNDQWQNWGQQIPSGGDLPISDRQEITRVARPRGSVGFFPILVSSALFAGLHMAHGPDWIPLLFLAFGLGYLYRQTHRLLPCIIVHVLLNSCSMGMFLVELLG